MIKKTVSNTVKILASFFIASLLLLTLFFFLLKNGIEIDHLRFPSIYIEKLYLKLDKKLILKIDKLNIKKEKKVKKDIDNFIKSFKYLPKLFKEIDIKQINFLNYHVTFLYSDKIYFIDTNNYQFAAKLHIHNHTLYADIPKIFLKQFGLFIKGKATIDLKSSKLDFIGDYDIHNLNGNAKIKIVDKIVKFDINSKYFNNKTLKKITDIFPLNKKIKNWIYKYIVAKKYKLEYLKGEIDLNSKKLFNPDKIFALAFAYDTTIKFNSKAEPVVCKKVTLNYQNDSLYFDLLKPKYLNKDIEGSYVVIKNLTNKNSYIDVIIKTKTQIDEKIKKLLMTYDIDLPIYQKKGITKGVLKIKVTFKNNKLDVEGVFTTKNSLLDIEGIELIVHKAKIKLKNSSLNIDSSYVEIKDIIKAFAKGFIDLNKKRAQIKLSKNYIKISFDNIDILNIDNFKDSLTINFSYPKYTKLIFKNLNTILYIYKNKTAISIKNLEKLKPYSNFLQKIDIKKGNINISTTDYKQFNIQGELVKDNRFLYKNKKFIKNFKIKGVIDKKRSIVFANGGKIKVIYENFPKIYIKEYDIKLKKDIVYGNKKEKLPDFYLFGKSSNIHFNEHTILSEKYSLKINKSQINFNSRYKNGSMNFKGNTNNFVILASKLNDEFVKKFLNIYGIEGGEYFLQASGNINNLQGEVKFYNSTLKDLALINNIMAFLNTIPALVTFSDPGYSTKGFKVKKGEICFRLKNGILNIDKLSFNGKSLNVEGVGKINLKSNTIDMKLKLKTFKKVTDIISKIPVAGYILLGEEGGIFTVLKLEGNLMKPKITTKLPQETLKAPVNIIKRTLQLPFKIFR